MANIRQSKIAELFKRDLGSYFQRNAQTVCKGAMVTVTVVRISKDLSVAKVYLSIFAAPDKQETLKFIQSQSTTIRHEMAKLMKNQMRKVPELHFYLDDSLDYAETIDGLLKK